MLSQNFKRVMSILLIVSMTFCSQGFSVLANAVPEVVDQSEEEDTHTGSQSAKNYYLEYKEEQTLIVKTGNVGGDENASQVESKNENASENGAVEPSINDGENEEENANENLMEEPEDDVAENNSQTSQSSEEENADANAENSSDENDSSNSSTGEEAETDATENSSTENEDEKVDENTTNSSAASSDSSAENEDAETTTVAEENSDETTTDASSSTDSSNENEETKNEATENENTETTTVENGEETTTQNASTESEETTTTAQNDENENNETKATEKPENSDETNNENETNDETKNNETNNNIKNNSENSENTSDDAEEGTASEIEEIENGVEVDGKELDKVDDIKNAKTDIEFVESTESNADKEIVVIKKYIYATRSIPEDSVWTFKEILATDQQGSFINIPDGDVVREKYLVKNVKVLLVNQYGDEKVVTVPAKWDVRNISTKYFPEGYVAVEKEYNVDKEGKLVVKDKEGNVEKTVDIEETANANDATNVDANAGEPASVGATDDNAVANDVEVNLNETDSIEETADKSVYEEFGLPKVEETVAGFAGTEDAEKSEFEKVETESENVTLNAKEETNETFGENNENATTNENKNEEEYDSTIDDKEVVYEYEEVESNEPIKVDDDEAAKSNALVGNANTNLVSKDTAKEVGVAIIDMEEIMKELAENLGAPVMTDGAITPFDIPLFGAAPTDHRHWVCGRTNCSDEVRNHFNENMDTKHPTSGRQYYHPVNSETELETMLADSETDGDYTFIYLTQDITITKMIKVFGELYICLNGHTMKFDEKGQICTYYDMTNPTSAESQKGSGVLGHAICFCGCTVGATGTSASGYVGKLDGQDIVRRAPAIYYTKNKGVYFYGLGNSTTVDVQTSETLSGERKIRIEGFITTTGNQEYIPRKAQPNTNTTSGVDVYAWPNNYMYDSSYNTTNGIADRPWFKDINSPFLCMSVNSTTQAAGQTEREAFFYGLEVYKCFGVDGGFANLYYINSLAVEHCEFRNCRAPRGPVISADFNNRQFFNKSTSIPENAYIDIAHNYLVNNDFYNSASSVTNEDWGTLGKYNNGTKVDTTGLTNPTIRDNKIFRPDESGIFLLENYNGGTHLQEYRIIKKNYFSYNNTNRSGSSGNDDAADGYNIYLTLDSIGSNTINVSDNNFYGGDVGAIYVENKYNEVHGTSVANQGTINFDNNRMTSLQMQEGKFRGTNRPLTRGVLHFENLAKVNINTGVNVTTQLTYQFCLGIGTGPVYAHNVDQVSIYSTKFLYDRSTNVGGSSYGSGGRTASFIGAGAVYLSSCSEVNIGHPTVDQANKVVFEGNYLDDYGGANLARGAGAIYAVDVKTLNINDVEFNGNQGTTGGAIAMIGENSDTNLNIYGSTFTNNRMNQVTTGDLIGGAIYYKGDAAHAHSHKIYSSYYLNQARVSTFSNNYVNNHLPTAAGTPVDRHADDIYLENITEDSDLKYIDMSNPSYIGLSEIAVVNSPARVALSYATLKVTTQLTVQNILQYMPRTLLSHLILVHI